MCGEKGAYCISMDSLRVAWYDILGRFDKDTNE